MVGFNSTSAFFNATGTLQASTRFPSPRSAAEDGDFQPINTPAEEPEEATDTEPAAQTSKKFHAPLPQHFTPLVKPSGHNWLAYAGIGTVATGVGAFGGFGYKAVHLPNSKIELKEGWNKFERTNSEVDGKVNIMTPEGTLIRYSLGRDPNEISILTYFEEEVINGKTCEGTCFDRTAHAHTVQYRLITDNQSTIEGLLVDANLPNGKLKDKSLYVAWKDPNAAYGIIGGPGKQLEENAPVPKATNYTIGYTIIEPPNTNEGWQRKLTNLWEKLSLEHEQIDDVYAEFQKQGYKITTGYPPPPTFRMNPGALSYKSWDDVAKAAVKNEKDWWKLVPQEGLGKFVGVGVLAGLAVAGAGIGLWELAHKKQPSQPTLYQLTD
jgi:hypothetical protein